MALLKILTAPKLAGIAEKNAQEEKAQHKESVCHVEKAHSRAPSSATAMEACREVWGYICTRWLSRKNAFPRHFLHPHIVGAQSYLLLQGGQETSRLLGAAGRATQPIIGAVLPQQDFSWRGSKLPSAPHADFPKRREWQREKIKMTTFPFQEKQAFSQPPN